MRNNLILWVSRFAAGIYENIIHKSVSYIIKSSFFPEEQRKMLKASSILQKASANTTKEIWNFFK